MPHQNTQTVDVWFTSSTEVCVTTAPYPRIHRASGETFAQKERVSGPCQNFPKDLNYTDWLIRSALIAISNDRNNMKLCVCHTHPSLAAVAPCTILSGSMSDMSGAGERVGVVPVMNG